MREIPEGCWSPGQFNALILAFVRILFDIERYGLI